MIDVSKLNLSELILTEEGKLIDMSPWREHRDAPLTLVGDSWVSNAGTTWDEIDTGKTPSMRDVMEAFSAAERAK